MIQGLAAYLFRSNLRPAALKNVEDVGMVLLAANDLGIPLTQAMNKLVVQNGRLSMMGELMSALILRDGHSIRWDEANDRTFARVYGRRRGEDLWHSGEFTIDEAVAAGLCHYDDDSKIVVRSNEGKPLPWELYTSDMLCWRALARLARRSFSDCLGGVSYTPDELGYIDAESADQLSAPGRRPAGRAGEAEPTMTLRQQQNDLARRIAELPEDFRLELREEWKRLRLPKPDDLRPGAIRQAHRLIEAAETTAQERYEAEHADVVEADVVEDVGADTPAPEAGAVAVGEAITAPVPDTDVGDGNGSGTLDLNAAEPEDDDPTELCVGCGEPIADEEHPVYDDEERPWHLSCSPF